ncbi:MAG: nitroreductase family protein [Vampirovibrionales bacterium]|nr:nitroreductase family protein [Vampirovibrionales bacterium]
MTTATAVLDTLSAIEQRRSVKHYDPTHVMPEALQRQLLELTLLSPTSFNIQNWRFVVVTSPAIKEQLCAAAWNQKQVVEASITVLICANLKSWEQEPERYWANNPDAGKYLVPMIGQFYANNPQLEHDEALRSVGIASQTLMLAAKALGYDSCPMIGFDPVKVGEIINLPKDHMVGLMVTVGKAAKPAHDRGGQLPYDTVVLQNHF